jgi:hypothetical protein
VPVALSFSVDQNYHIRTNMRALLKHRPLCPIQVPCSNSIFHSAPDSTGPQGPSGNLECVSVCEGELVDDVCACVSVTNQGAWLLEPPRYPKASERNPDCLM